MQRHLVTPLPSPLLCFLGLPETHTQTVQLLLMLGRKAIMSEWIRVYTPSVQLWRSLVSEVVALDREY